MRSHWTINQIEIKLLIVDGDFLKYEPNHE